MRFLDGVFAIAVTTIWDFHPPLDLYIAHERSENPIQKVKAMTRKTLSGSPQVDYFLMLHLEIAMIGQLDQKPSGDMGGPLESEERAKSIW